MVKDHEERPLYGLLLQVANPALITAMVGSLIFFLIEMFYRGPHVLRLNLIMALFTIATVLVSRISIEAGKERAAMFAAGLALATLATTSVVVDFQYDNLAMLEPVVIIFLIATVMWVTNRLVWDCTLLGKTRDVSAMGLLEAIRQKFVPRERAADVDEGSLGKKKRGNKKSNGKSKSADSFGVFEFMLGRNGKNTTPGLWVFYLAIAAFPIFGFGQWFVNPTSSGFSIFFLFAVYLSSGLGLLMVTSLLGLKRYVNKRGVSIPEPVAMNWLFVGTLFLIGLMLVFSFLPRPDLSSTMNDYLAFLVSEEKTSELAIGQDNDFPDKQDPNQNAKPKRKPQNEQDGDQPPPENAPVADGKRGDETDPNSSEKKEGGGNESSDSKSGEGKGGDDKKSSGKDGQGKEGKQDNEKGRGDEGEGKEGAKKDNAKGDQAKGEQAKGDPQPNNQQELEKKPDGQPNGQPNKAAKLQRPAAPPPPSFKPDSSNLRWMAYGLIGLIFLAIILLNLDKLLRMWQQLFGVKEREDEVKDTATVSKIAVAPRPFSSFSDPFASGMARKTSPEKLMEYSFEAIRAWLNERGVDVSGHFTSDDLVAAIEGSTGKNQKDFRSFSIIFNQTIYGDHPPSSDDLQSIERIWRFMKTSSGANRTGDVVRV